MDECLPSEGGDHARSLRVLICEDSDPERTTLSSYLQSCGYETREAANGMAALEELKSHEVDLILLDLHMPGMSGFEVLAYLQEHRRGLPVIVMSGLPVDEIQSHIRALPHPELPPLLLKPIDIDKLLPLMDLVMSEQLAELERNARPPEESN